MRLTTRLLAAVAACLIAAPTLAFQQPVVLRGRTAAVAATPLRPAVLCTAAPDDATPAVSRQPGRIRRMMSRVGSALAIGVAGVLMQSPMQPIYAARKAPPAPPPKARASPALNFGMCGAMTGGFVYWSYVSAKDEDEDEQKRIKKESERMESLAKEFTDIDGGVGTDEDIMASLRKKMQNQTDDGEGGGDEPGMGPPPDAPMPPPPTLDSGGGAAVLEPPTDDAPEQPKTATPEEIERLKRMFGSGGDS